MMLSSNKWMILPGMVTLPLLAGCDGRLKDDLDKIPVSDRPNIVFILADDMGYGDISALNPTAGVRTPNLDRMCREGMRFTEAHSCSAVSSPSRYGILTGRYNIRGPLKHGVLSGYSAPVIESTRPTMASVLKNVGYKTGICGKWHLGLGWQTESGQAPDDNNTDFTKPLTYTPNDVGFDVSCILPASLDMTPYVCVSDRYVEDQDIVDEAGCYPADYRGHMWRPGKRSSGFDIQNTLEFFTLKAKDFVRENAGGDRPFFLYMPLTAPHTPWSPTEQFRGKSQAGDYGDFVLNVDDVVGQMMTLLDSLHILDNTVLVFSSDNGADWSSSDKKTYAHRANYIWRGRKSDLWDGGHHIPLIFRYPPMVKHASVSSALVCLTDLLSTFASLGRAPIPVGGAEDSQSFVSVLSGESLDGDRTEVIHQSNDGSLAIRRGRWKYIDCSGSGGWSQAHGSTLPQCQLYDMVSDPEESENLYAKYPDLVVELKNQLDEIIK